ncbi:c-type cytochrome [Acidomonas methanolica]|uniref:c-type cytochrome n=1 Tax=Acidomonas methanolica TaxID=437 RepID=UPI00211A2F1C|nr:c-type cytochrome [Acidomonas methanolica]MCQ9155342.1 c-type cytochrome [Acidomonas methanolica]
MNKRLTVLIAPLALCAAAFVVPAAHAQSDGEAIAKGSDCFSCHSVDAKVVGPAFKDVAKKFAGDSSAEATLVDAIDKGHSGTWGNIPMPPHPNLTPAQTKQIVQWILGLK